MKIISKNTLNTQFNTTLANITQQGVVDVNNLYSNLLAQPLVGGAVSNAGTNITANHNK